MATGSQKLIDFFNSAKQKRFSKGELVLSGENPSGVTYIQDGFVEVYSISDSGDRYVHIMYKAGEIFPMIWAIHGIRRRVFYEAAGDVTVAEAAKDDFLNFIKKDALVAYEVMLQLAQQFYVFADRLDNLEYKAASERVAYRIVFLANRFGDRRGNKVTINAPLTHEFISRSVNLSRETVSRQIEKFEKANLIHRQDGLIVVDDLEKLSAEFSEPITLDLWGLKND